MVIELGSSHVLELWPVANIAAEFGANELSVSLEFTKSLPNDLSIHTGASMREFTEIDTVLENLVNFLEEVARGLAIGAADIEAWSWSTHLSLLIHWASTGSHEFVIDFRWDIFPLHSTCLLVVDLFLYPDLLSFNSSIELKLAVFAE